MLQPAAQLPVTEMHFKDRVCANQYEHLRTLPLYKFDNSYDRQSHGVWTVTFMFFTLSSKAVLLHYHWQGKEEKKKKSIFYSVITYSCIAQIHAMVLIACMLLKHWAQ